jgi:hypothetical protein
MRELVFRYVRLTLVLAVVCFITGTILGQGKRNVTESRAPEKNTRKAGVEPLTYPELITALTSKPPAGITKGQVLAKLIADVGERGVDEPLTADREDDLRQAGATDELIQAIESNAPPTPKKPRPDLGTVKTSNVVIFTQPGAVVMLQGAVKPRAQKADPSGIAVFETVAAGKHGIRAELEGFETNSGEVVVVSQKTTGLALPLTPTARSKLK